MNVIEGIVNNIDPENVISSYLSGDLEYIKS